jgi:hypothetical protein
MAFVSHPSRLLKRVRSSYDLAVIPSLPNEHETES